MKRLWLFKKMYYIYHIPGKKIGVTTDLLKRVTKTQGYKEKEYEIILQSEDINYISEQEIKLQKKFGYKVDVKPYNKLFNQMKVNVTEQTTTFPVPKNQLKKYLKKHVNENWKTELGLFYITNGTIEWISKNAKKSMFNNDRCFIYNKAYYEEFLFRTNGKNIFDRIRAWAKERNMYQQGDIKTQVIKLYEETGELSEAILKEDTEATIDGIGDTVVVLTNLAEHLGVNIEDCIEHAYEQIKDRKGKMINGTFVKNGN